MNAKEETRLQRGERLLRNHRKRVFDAKTGPAHVRAIIRLRLLLTPALVASSTNVIRARNLSPRHA